MNIGTKIKLTPDFFCDENQGLLLLFPNLNLESTYQVQSKVQINQGAFLSGVDSLMDCETKEIIRLPSGQDYWAIVTESVPGEYHEV